MNQLNNFKIYNKRIPIPVGEQYSIFLQLHAAELKYMTPWTQYDDEGLEENTYYREDELQQQNKVVDNVSIKNKKDNAETNELVVTNH